MMLLVDWRARRQLKVPDRRLSAILFLLLAELLPSCAGLSASTSPGAAPAWSHEANGYVFHWDWQADFATLSQKGRSAKVWQGPLLPGLWLTAPGGRRMFVKAEPSAASTITPSGGVIRFTLAAYGTGELRWSAQPWGLRFEEMSLRWDQVPPAIVALYFGAAPLTPDQETIVPSLDRPFWPNWSAEGFCVPSGKGAPVQSFFRNWDLGHATLPLGSFGPSLGTPYAAAFPRPLYSAAMGGPAGWMALGPGAVPDAALLFEIRATTGALDYLYREDLWGAPPGNTRVWTEPLRIAWAATAWDAFQSLFGSFGPAAAAPPIHQLSHWNTWGNFKERRYDLRLEARQAALFGARVVVIDDGWESTTGSGVPDPERFPHFLEDLEYIRSKGLALGLWMTCGWVSDPQAAGLTPSDLLAGKDGRPRRAAWNMALDKLPVAKYCLDPSSPAVRQFLRRRTARVMREYGPQVLKLDFGYGLPGPDVSAPRNPAFRGERLAWELLRIIADAAREVKPDVSIQYYGIHPLMRPVTDVIALDDLGDAGAYEAEAHSQWSVWSALAAGRGAAIMASSGYDWNADPEVLLDTAVIGAPGSVLPIPGPGQPALPESRISRRRAIVKWHRRTTGWEPLWLNSDKGALGREPRLRCFGRMERIGGTDRLTALALRPEKPTGSEAGPLRGMRWQGRWALLSQDDSGIFSSRMLACVPFDRGFLDIPLESPPARVVAVHGDHEQPAAGWRFERGSLRLEVPREDDSLLGFLVLRQAAAVASRPGSASPGARPAGGTTGQVEKRPR